jgi:hypothetical protein
VRLDHLARGVHLLAEGDEHAEFTRRRPSRHAAGRGEVARAVGQPALVTAHRAREHRRFGCAQHEVE